MQQTYKRTPMPKCVVNEVARHYWNCTSTWVFSCKFTAYIWKSFLQEHLREPVSVKDLYVWSNFVKVWVRYKRFFAVRVSTISIPITRWTSTWKGTKYDFLKRTIFPHKEKLLRKRDLNSFLSVLSCQFTVSGRMNRLWVVLMHRKKNWRYWAHVSKAFKFGTCHEILY